MLSVTNLQAKLLLSHYSRLLRNPNQEENCKISKLVTFWKGWLDQFKKLLAIENNNLYTTKAAEALGELLSSPNELIRRGTANDILNHVVKFRELQELGERISILEEKTKGIL